ncbi:class I SAM-dependent methyltransferase [Sphingobium sp.]|uniref:class I SAM-dependent methyltransferase n=1 Tax=Sphingobium sp. TaxID=1912891 RepID=UPI00262477B2|nr:class I SAM-dependent methyltransferase [Sphingobium sp.]
MNDWSHGYDISAGYTYGFRNEMAPDWMDLCARLAGQAPPRASSGQPYRYLELGCGQGVGLCLLAAANPHSEFLGVDFLPDHVAHAQALASAAGLTNVRFSDGDFVALAQDWPQDFGRFDYVTLHGVYSWITTAVRQALVRCLDHAAAPGALVYISYNAQPGWLGSMPFRHISRLIRENSDAPSGDVLDASIGLFDRMAAGGANIFQILPGLKARIASVKNQSKNYLIHEFLHEGWHPLWHSEVAAEVAGADLHFAGSATIADTLLPSALPPALRQTIEEQQVERVRQDVQDLAVNQSFRRDLFRRGKTAAPEKRDDAAIGRTRLHMIAPPPGETIDIKASFGEITLQRPAYDAIFATLAKGPATIAELLALPFLRQQGTDNALQILALLLHSKTIGVGPDHIPAPDAAHRLNRAIASSHSATQPYTHIAAPALGSAVPVSPLDLTLLDLWCNRPEGPTPDALARAAIDAVDGQPLLPALSPATALGAATTFLHRDLPRWRMLGAIP